MKKALLLSAALTSTLALSPAMAETLAEQRQAYEFAGIAPAAGDEAVKSHGEFIDALIGGDVDLSFRYRIEHVDSDAFAKDATAGTLQSLLGYRTGTYKDASAYVQIRDVTVLGPDHYNDTINGETTRPVIADPDATEIDQAYLEYNGFADTKVTVGRRKLKWGNRRFVAALGWRQNNRSFDGAVIENKSLPNTELKYAFATNVNRAFTDNSPNGNFDDDTRVHLLNAEYSGLPIGKLTGYGYFLDLDGATPAAGLSTKTYGANLTGKQSFGDVDLLYTAEYARQSDYGDNPTSFDADYYRVEPGISYKGLTVKAGYEVLGSDNGVKSFTTPLALLHAYNGWADVFVNTPANGLEDAYASATYKWKGTGEFFDGGSVQVAYHDFQADEGGADYGTEWDAVVGVKFLDHYNASVKFADYKSDGFASDTQKVFVTIGAKF